MDGLRGRLGRIIALYTVPLTIFGLVASIPATYPEIGSAGLPWLLAGAGGMLGSAAVIAAAVRLRRHVTRAGADTEQLRRTRVLALAARAGMAAVGVVVAAIGVPVAPSGMDDTLMRTVNVGLGVALVLFALFASDLSRAARTTG